MKKDTLERIKGFLRDGIAKDAIAAILDTTEKKVENIHAKILSGKMNY